ncbi:MAG: aldehyde ferredoxin oxidoreductase N-terminal domain-containing protein [Desulfosudaceae bacterium]
MNISGGFTRRILLVDLTAGTTRVEALDPELARDFIGGLGLTLRLAADLIPAGGDALSPDNAVVIGAGPLVGTDVPSSSRIYAVTRLPTPGTIGWCGAGGVTFGCRLKNAGFDHIILTGASDRLVYLHIDDDTIELRDAAAIRGRTIPETCRALRRAAGGKGGVLAIGPAGENRVFFSMAGVDGVATLGRGGLGAVLGAKKLKGIVVNGSRGVGVADDRRYRELVRPLWRRIRDYPYLKEWQHLGMLKAFPMVAPDIYEIVKKRRLACVSCPIGCKDEVEIKDGSHQGLVVSSSSALNLFTPLMYGFQDYRESVKLIADLDDLGLDMFEFFGITRLAADLVANGIIPAVDNDPAIVLDSLDSLAAWAGKIARRQGLGEVMADGFAGLTACFGPAAHKHAPALIKGMHPYTGPGSAIPWDLFGTMELGQLLESRGPHVGSGGSPTYFARRPRKVFPRHLARMGVLQQDIDRILPEQRPGAGPDPLNVGALLKYSHRWFAVLGSLGLCARGQVNRFYDAETCAALYQAITGIPTSLEQLRHRADRVWTLYRMINLREKPAEPVETVPRQWVVDSGFNTGFKEYFSERPLTGEEIAGMIKAYYREQGWDEVSGRPTAATLRRFDLDRLFS